MDSEPKETAFEFNQVLEQSPNGSEIPSQNGENIEFSFRCDRNLSNDFSQTFIAIDIDVQSGVVVSDNAVPTFPVDDDDTVWSKTSQVYYPSPQDFYPDAPLRLFDSMSHVVDGVTVEHSDRPWSDKRLQQRFLNDRSEANKQNFASVESMCNPQGKGQKSIAAHLFGNTSHNQQTTSFVTTQEQNEDEVMNHVNGANMWAMFDSGVSYTRDSIGPGGQTRMLKHTVYFQPPFDSWRVHQRVSGGEHKITLRLKPTTTETVSYITAQGSDSSTLGTTEVDSLWGSYMTTPAKGNKIPVQHDMGVRMHSIENVSFKSYMQYYAGGIKVDLKRIRLVRRQVRLAIERPIRSQEFNTTKIQYLLGDPSATGVTQNFLLPSSTYGLVFYWTRVGDSYLDQFDDYKRVNATRMASAYGTTSSGDAVNGVLSFYQLRLNEFYFRYGGRTIPEQRITNIHQNNKIANQKESPGWLRLQHLAQMLRGQYNTPQMDAGFKYMDSDNALAPFNESMFYFPVARHTNADNADMQVTWSSDGSRFMAIDTTQVKGVRKYVESETRARLVVAALYDARVEYLYNEQQTLDTVRVTEWR